MALTLDIYVYVAPDTREIDGIYLYSVMGTLVRKDGDWEPITLDEDPNLIQYVNNDITYEINYDKLPDDAVGEADPTNEDEWPEHPLIVAYDNGEATEDMVKQYCDLINVKSDSEADVA